LLERKQPRTIFESNQRDRGDAIRHRRILLYD
jgi:hypothetical protein